jgi:conjugative relaxase-like TrwC/TraI family protein
MVTIGKLGKGKESYYLDSVADGAEDYYAGEGEAPGRWTCAGARELELSGEVERAELRAVLSARDARTAEPLPRFVRKDRVPGFDATFSAPKSVSVLWAVADRETATRIRDAHERAVDAALGYLEREAAFTRLGHDGPTAARGKGFVAAAFGHRMSRAGDPQLHTHVLVANLIHTPDGAWRSLDGQRLYRRAKTAGYLYQAHLRAELARELGFTFREVHRGAAEIAGVPDETLRAFSRRRAEIEARMASRGGTSRRSAEVAALETRRAKDYGVRPATQRREWRERARASGLSFEAALQPSGRNPEPPPESMLFRQVESALTAERSSFARRHVVEELAAAHRQGASVDEIKRLADRFLSRTRVIELGEARPAGAPASAPAEPLYTTREVLALEERLVRRAAVHQHRRLAVAEPAAVEAALARDPALGDDQRELVRRLALGGEGTACVLGRAGAGKTRALRPLREALEGSGVEVIGAAVQNTAARILEQEAGIRSTSLTRLLYEADVQGYGLPRRGVVVIDEAAMASTRALASLQEFAVRNRARLVLVGDPAQLPAIEHPGAFRALVDRLGAIELAEVRRLSDPVERAAVELVRAGRGSAALEAYDERGRLTLADSVAELEAAAVADRHRAQGEGADAIVLARTRARTQHLNQLAQALRVAEGQLGGEGIEVGEGRIRAGDLVVTRVNRGGREPVHNRERWVVEAIDVEARAMTLRHLTERERVVTLERDYLDRRLPDAIGPVELGYAITKYGAQGMTVDRAFAVLTDGLSREDAYVALTRARDATQLYALAREPVERAEFAPSEAEREVGVADLGRDTERSEGLALAIDERLRAELERRPTEALVAELERFEARRDDPDRRRASALRAARAEAEAALARLRQGLAATPKRDPGRAYREASCEHAAQRLRRLRAEERALPVAQIDPGVSRQRAAAIERILAERRRERVVAAIEAEPAYLVEAIGRRPGGLRARLEWKRAVDQVERVRQRLGITDSKLALGAEPRGAEARMRWREATRELDRLRARIAERGAAPELGRSRSRRAGLEL